jgi:hypothetical protein
MSVGFIAIASHALAKAENTLRPSHQSRLIIINTYREIAMLYSIDSESEVTTVPHYHDFVRWRKGLTDNEYEMIVRELNTRIDGTEIQTSSWIPGCDWSDTVFHPIYETACSEDEVAAAKFFGLIVWDAFLRHPAWWAFGRYEKDGIPITGLTYFKIKPPR